MLTVGVLADHCPVIDSALMVLASGVLAFVVLHDELLLAVFDVLPIGLELHIEDGVTPKD